MNIKKNFFLITLVHLYICVFERAEVYLLFYLIRD